MLLFQWGDVYKWDLAYFLGSYCASWLLDRFCSFDMAASVNMGLIMTKQNKKEQNKVIQICPVAGQRLCLLVHE